MLAHAFFAYDFSVYACRCSFKHMRSIHKNKNLRKIAPPKAGLSFYMWFFSKRVASAIGGSLPDRWQAGASGGKE
jgi:hypothetical protein